MNEFFGVSITTYMIVLVALLGVCLATVGWIALRRPVVFKLGVRNIPRRKAQTVLTVVGLMLSTLIITAAFGTGDTLIYSLTSDVYDNLGHVDELVVSSQGTDARNASTGAAIPASAYAVVQQATAGNAGIDGVMPLLDAHIPVSNEASKQIEPEVVLTGLDPAQLESFGGLRSTSGVQAVSIQEKIDEGRGQVMSFFSIIQGFMGLGLLVGVAAIGVIAFRSVVERRQQIGVLRAIGFQRNEISLSFLIESIFIVGLGVISGTTLGLMQARNLFMGNELDAPETLHFIIP